MQRLVAVRPGIFFGGAVLAFFPFFGFDGGRGVIVDHHHRRQRLGLGIRIDEVHHQIAKTRLVGLDQVHHAQHLADGRGAGGDRLDALADAIFDTLGKLDFTLAGEQLDRTHFTHVHAHRVGGAAELVVHRRGQHLLGLLVNLFLVLGGGGFGFEQQRVRVRGLVVHLDPHVVDHVDHRFDLIGVVHTLGEVVVDVPVSQEALFLALDNELLELQPLGFLIHEKYRNLSQKEPLSLHQMLTTPKVLSPFRRGGCQLSPSKVVLIQSFPRH